MDELIDLVAERTGLTKVQSKMAVETMMEFMEKRLPGPMAARLRQVLESDSLSNLNEFIDIVGDLLGKRDEEAVEVKETAEKPATPKKPRKKPTSKKTTAKKPTAKKAATKKTAKKKPSSRAKKTTKES